MRMLADVGKFLENQARVHDLRDSVALEYYELVGAALPLECLSAHKPDRRKCFSLSLPLQLPAELAAFLSKHPAEREQLKTDLKTMQVELDSAFAGDKLRASAAHLLLLSFTRTYSILVLLYSLQKRPGQYGWCSTRRVAARASRTLV